LIGLPFADPANRLASLGSASVLVANMDQSRVRPVLDEIDRIVAMSGLPTPPIAIAIEALLSVTAGDDEQAVNNLVAVRRILGRYDGLLEMVEEFRGFAACSAHGVDGVCGRDSQRDDRRSLRAVPRDSAASRRRPPWCRRKSLEVGAGRSGGVSVLRRAGRQRGRCALRTSLAPPRHGVARRVGAVAGDAKPGRTTIETDTEAGYLDHLRSALGGDFDSAIDVGRRWNEGDFIQALQEVLSAIQTDTMTNDVLGA
jgi:hypothetical protein